MDFCACFWICSRFLAIFASNRGFLRNLASLALVIVIAADVIRETRREGLTFGRREGGKNEREGTNEQVTTSKVMACSSDRRTWSAHTPGYCGIPMREENRRPKTWFRFMRSYGAFTDCWLDTFRRRVEKSTRLAGFGGAGHKARNPALA
jgi:hypothetical protein